MDRFADNISVILTLFLAMDPILKKFVHINHQELKADINLLGIIRKNEKKNCDKYEYNPPARLSFFESLGCKTKVFFCAA